MNIPTERQEELYSLWGSETNAPETEEWRDELTLEEQEMVAQWDEQFETGIENLMQDMQGLSF